MEQATKKRRLLSPRTGTIIGIIVIVLAALSIIISGPREAEHDSLFSDDLSERFVAFSRAILQCSSSVLVHNLDHYFLDFFYWE